MSHVTKFRISGVHCQACEKLISLRLKQQLPEIEGVHIDIQSGDTHVFTSRPLSLDQLTTALKDLPYKIIGGSK